MKNDEPQVPTDALTRVAQEVEKIQGLHHEYLTAVERAAEAIRSGSAEHEVAALKGEAESLGARLLADSKAFDELCDETRAEVRDLLQILGESVSGARRLQESSVRLQESMVRLLGLAIPAPAKGERDN